MSLAHSDIATERRPGDLRVLPRADVAMLRLVRGTGRPRRSRFALLGPTTISLVIHAVAAIVLLVVTLSPPSTTGLGPAVSVTFRPDVGEAPPDFEAPLPEVETLPMEELEPIEVPPMPVERLADAPLPPQEDDVLEALDDTPERRERLDLPLTVAARRIRPEPAPVTARVTPPAPQPRTRVVPAPRRRGTSNGGRLRPLHMPLFYPEAARQQGIQGVARVELIIGPDGGVLSVRLIASSGSGALDQAALTSARQWRFAPPGSLRRVRAPLRFWLHSR